MNRKATRFALPLALLVAVVPVAGAEAGSQPRANSQPTEIRLSSKSPAFSGRVSSRSDVCIKGRRVELMRKSSGGEPKLLGGDASGSTGSWAVHLGNVKPGAYYARTDRKVKGKGRSRTVCELGRSDVVVIG